MANQLFGADFIEKLNDELFTQQMLADPNMVQ